MTDADGQESLREELRAALAAGYQQVNAELARLRAQTDRQGRLAGNMIQREHAYRRIIEEQYHLLQAYRTSHREREGGGAVLTIPVAQAMDFDDADPPAPAPGGHRERLAGWLRQGASTDALVRPAPEAPDGGDGRAARIYADLRRPAALSYRASPGLAAFSAPRGDLRVIAMNLIGLAEEAMDDVAEEIAQSAAINRKFAPLILTTTRAGLGALRRRRLSYESLPRFNASVARLSGLESPAQFYDIRVGYLLRKWRAVAVMNLGPDYAYAAPA
jgi:hypothetical protein